MGEAQETELDDGVVTETELDAEGSTDDEVLDEALEPTLFGRAYDLFLRHRRRASKVVLAIFLVAVAVEIGGAIPRDVEVLYRFPDAGQVVEARLAYEDEGEHVREVTLRWRSGAPAIVRDTIELSPGDYDVSVLLVADDGAMRELHGELTAPADGVVRVRLQP